MAFNGYLLKANKTNTVFNNRWIMLESWKTTPCSREEIKATRDDNTRALTRVTASGTKTSITFVCPACNLSTKQNIQKFFTDNEVDTLQRKIQLTYWNDEKNSYNTGYFYRADTQFTIKKIEGSDIRYKEFEITLVEY